jgi:hypothetical protein
MCALSVATMDIMFITRSGARYEVAAKEDEQHE